MLETARDTSCPSKGTFCSLCVRLALATLMLAGGLFIALALTNILPEKTVSWQAALPWQGMDTQKAEASLLKAKSIHEAVIRPQLINAGFVSAKDIGNEGHRERSTSAQLTNILWSMRSFPEVHDSLFNSLLDKTIPIEKRLERFYTLGSFLAQTAQSLEKNTGKNRVVAHHRPHNRHYSETWSWFRYFNENPDFSPYPVEKKDRESWAEKRALAGKILPMILADVSRDFAARTALETKEHEEAKALGKNLPPHESKAWAGRSRERYLHILGRSVSRAVSAFWLHRDNTSLLPLAKEFLATCDASLAIRYDCIPLIAQKPGLPASEYLFWNQYKRDLDSISSCVSTAPRSYTYLIDCCDKLGTVASTTMKQRGTLSLDGWHGPAITLTKTKSFQPVSARGDNLYLLVDMPQALKDAPDYDMSRAYPIFANMLFRHLDNQPHILPLNPANAKDAALIAWYNEKGWELNRTLLFSATGSSRDIASHWGGVHLSWWPDRSGKDKGEPRLAYLHPENGYFMLGVLPQLRGKAASRFLGPVTGLWFGRKTIHETGWVDEKYEARPERGIAQLPLPVSIRKKSALLTWASRKLCADTGTDAVKKATPYNDALATIAFGPDISKALDVTFEHNNSIDLARELQKLFPTPEATPQEVFSFTEKNLVQLAHWGIMRNSNARSAIQYLWQFRNDPKAVALMNQIFSKKDIPARARVEHVRRALDLPKKGEN